ncbi:AgaS family sugar isomerase [Enterobacter cloacae]|uniref:AgaS family sugar isomerase n=1 Tax=Enterobacter cloacae TaxID=550 RepID=A0A377LSH0_ENTCL|nr:AgaS family sugar isomerase [Enterobacter cloacae]
MPECYHLSITCNEAGNLYQSAIDSDNACALLMPAETHDRGFAMTSSITTMMASCLAVFAPETINSNTFRDVADRCQAILTSLGDFRHGVFGTSPGNGSSTWEAVACRGGARIGAEGTGTDRGQAGGILRFPTGSVTGLSRW